MTHYHSPESAPGYHVQISSGPETRPLPPVTSSMNCENSCFSVTTRPSCCRAMHWPEAKSSRVARLVSSMDSARMVMTAEEVVVGTGMSQGNQVLEAT